MEIKFCLGLDLSKKDFKACLVIVNQHQEVKVKASRTFSNTNAGFEQLWEWTKKKRKKGVPFNVVMEATGVYHENLAWFFFKKKTDIHILLPNRTKAYMVSLGHKSKNDIVDAKGLAIMGVIQKLPLWQPFSEDIYKLRALTRHLEDLQSIRTTLINQREHLQYAMHHVSSVAKSIGKTLKAIDKQIADCKEEIEATLKKDEIISRKVEAMTSIKGVSTLTAAVLIAETNAFALINNVKQLTSYAGYDIRENQSGQKAGKTRITKKGNAHIRRAMHLPAFNVVRFELKPFFNLYNRVYEKSSIKMKGYVAVQSKLLTILYTLWKNETAFDETYQITTENHKIIAPEKSEATLGELLIEAPLHISQI